MANNRELSQLGSIVNINDSNRTLGIAASVGIGTTVADYQLHVQGDINFTDNLYKDGELFTSGVGAGVGTITPNSGIITGRVGFGFTDINFIGTGITVTGYGSTVVVDMNAIAAASAGASGDDAIRFAIAFG
ncbi:hypothetical protein CMO86_07535 [Candidatus Woesearchaeota archaeon]|nr:hypothetical protein [Candidatus Woesearchaeota archaeon]